MGARLFLSQELVDRAAAAGAVALSDDALVARGGPLDGARFALVPAARVRGVAGGPADPHRLCGKVRTVAQLVADGGEVLGTSMLLGDAAYDLEPGYLAGADPAVLARLLPPCQEAGRPSEEATWEGQSDAEALARFLLNTLP